MKKVKTGKNVKSAESGTKKKLIKELDKLWGEYVRKRDGSCIVCGSCNHLQAHHIFSRRYFNTRFNIDNGVSLCFAHHHHLAHSLYEEFRDKMIEFIGIDKYESLKKESKEIVKYSSDDLLTLKNKLLQKIGELD
jgi:5-methylcytosine-specific restriction endonuclease McrA